MQTPLALLTGQFVHKLNNRIGSIRARIRMLQLEKADLLKQDKSLADEFDQIESDAREALLLTEAFRESFASPEGGEPVSIKVILSDALYHSNSSEKVSVILEVDEGIPEVQATNNLVDVFRNLATNAYEAMPDGGKLHVTAKINETDQNVEITFADTGRGMPAYVTDSLFQPYFSTKNQKGHGLGLWWSKYYLETIGGDLKLLWSEAGKGSSFLIQLPLRK